jgi:hypothetical protein
LGAPDASSEGAALFVPPQFGWHPCGSPAVDASVADSLGAGSFDGVPPQADTAALSASAVISPNLRIVSPFCDVVKLIETQVGKQ